jgi:hypothetical protein
MRLAVDKQRATSPASKVSTHFVHNHQFLSFKNKQARSTSFSASDGCRFVMASLLKQPLKLALVQLAAGMQQ